MIFKTKPIKYKLRAPSRDLTFNEAIRGSENLDEVTFMRYIGIVENREAYTTSLSELDSKFISNNVAYVKVTGGFSKLIDVNRVNEMKAVMAAYLELESVKHMDLVKLNHLHMGYCIPDETLEWTKKNAFRDIMAIYSVEHNNKFNKNLGIKLLYWMDEYLKEMFEDAHGLNKKRQIVYYGNIKNNEVYFLMLLTKLGVDVLYINPNKDISDVFPEIDKYSHLIQKGDLVNEVIPFPEPKIGNGHTATLESCHLSNQVVVPEPRPRLNQSMQRADSPPSSVEKSFEELALLAESVVMIKVYNEKEEVIGGGSGVVINDKGYIITNCHVVSGGIGFGVLFENDETEYLCPNIIKYHTDYDLALIKVEKRTKPFNLELRSMVRGQKICSIGSPMGLFNTISEGIVSGFRTFGQLDMVQITAPISPGSSGGALLDMYGNLVGITTAGIQGQNLNLTVPSRYIKEFAYNMVK